MFNNKSFFIIVAILTGTFIVPVNSTMISVGLPNMAADFDRSIAHITWVVTTYLIIMTVTQPLAGKLGDLYGRRRLFLIGLGLFFAASLACIWANDLTTLIIARSIQAVGGALITPNGTAMLRMLTPKAQLTKVFGTFGFSMSLGAAIGPLLGALLMSRWDWHAAFWVNIPLVALSFVIAYFVLPKDEAFKTSKVDWLGSLLLATWLTAFVLVLTKQAYTSIPLWIITVVGFGLFIYHEMQSSAPLIQFTMFRIPNFLYANISILFNNGIMYSTLLFMPLLLTTNEQFTITEIGLALFAFSVSISLCSWLGGRLESVLGRRRLIQLSFSLSAIAIGFYFALPITESLPLLLFLLFLGGIGSGLGVPSMQAASLQDIAQSDSGVASGIYSTFRYIGSTFASVMISLQWSATSTFALLIGCALLAIWFARGFSVEQ